MIDFPFSLFLKFQNLKACFESKDIDLLKKTISELPEEEARYHMKRCVDSGMWVPDASDLPPPEASETVTDPAATDAPATDAPATEAESTDAPVDADKTGAETEDEIYEDASSLSPTK